MAHPASIAITDYDWYDFLSKQRTWDEVNFWKPTTTQRFRAPEFSPFLFKLKRPNNHIAGGGFFVKFSVLPLSIVWETFGVKNGAATREEFEALIRPLTPDPRARDPHTGVFDVDGMYYFTVQGGNFIGRIDPATSQVTLKQPPTATGRPYGIVRASSGKFYFDEFNSNRIGELDPKTMTIKEYVLPAVGATCGQVT